MALIGSLTFPVSAGAQALDDFSFDAEACTFGPTLDAIFDDLQERFDAEVEDLGFGRRTYDNQVEIALRTSQPVNLRLGNVTISNIAINYENRLVFFAEEHNLSVPELQSRGVVFENADERYSDGSLVGNVRIVENSWVSDTNDDPIYDAETRTLIPDYDPLGKSRLICTLDRFVRMANEADENIDQLALVEFDPAIWDSDAESLAAVSDENFVSGDFAGAREASGALLAQLDAVGAQQGVEYAAALQGHARNLRALGQLTQARDLLARALEVAEAELGVEHPFSTDVLADYAFVLSDVGAWHEAIPMLNRAMWVRRERFGEQAPQTLEAYDRYGMAVAEVSIAEGEYMATGGTLDIGDALTYVTRAHMGRVEAQGPAHPETVASTANLALVMSEFDLAYATGVAGEAHDLAQQAYGMAPKAFGAAHPETLRAANVLTTVRLNAPKLSEQSALEPARQARAILAERSATSLTTPAGRAQRLRDRQSRRLSYENLADAAWTQASDISRLEAVKPEAFVALQQAMSGSTDRAVAEAAARRVAARQDTALGNLVARRQALADEWAQLDSVMVALLASESDHSAMRAQLRQRQTEIDSETAAIDARLRADAPHYFEFVSQQALGEAAAMALMGPDDAAMIVVPTRYGTHVMVVTSDSVAWNRADITREQVDDSVLRLLWDVGATVEVDDDQADQWAQEGEGAYPFDRTTAHNLYNALIAPIAHLLEGKEHLYIAASGSLSSLPFGVLVTQPPTGSDGDPNSLRKTAWFADAHALVQVPTLQSLQMQRMLAETRPIREGEGTFVGFGDPVLDGGAVTRGGGAVRRTRGGAAGLGSASASLAGLLRDGSQGVDVDAIKSMARLPGTSREINALARLFDDRNSQLYLAQDATEPNLRNTDLSSVSVLALATHGLLAGELDGVVEPGLVFTPPDEASPQNDGFLSASEVAELDLAAEWVILSACNTASGDGSEGAPGLSGLARAFFFAGAESLLASHWPVRDDVAARLTVRIMELTRDDPSLSRAQALQAAMREIRNDASQDSADDTLAHPNAWAPFALIGDR